MLEADEAAVVASERPQVARIFANTTDALCRDLEQRLHLAKKARRYELVCLRLHGVRLDKGTIPLRLLSRFLIPLNEALERAAWRVWDVHGESSQVSDDFRFQLDLRLAGIVAGSTELQLVGNTAPDLTGVSALETALQDLFDLFDAGTEDFADRVHAVGIPAAKSLSAFLTSLERDQVAAELGWNAPSHRCSWNGSPPEITRIRALLDDIGEPSVTTEAIAGTVNVLSIRNRLEVQRTDTGEKMRLGYHKSLAEHVHQLRLGDKRTFQVERTVYPFAASRRKRDAYRLLGIRGL